ncbi:Hydrogen cyanide synthase subunit HcnB [subsurface metagenome]
MAKESLSCDLAVVGGGPAGLAAAIEAAKAGVRVSLFDENEKPGGQLFKQIHKFFGSKEHQAGIRGHDIGYHLLDECQKVGVDTRLNTVVWGIEDNKIGIVNEKASRIVDAKRIIVATGASENPLSFPDWTLPGVMGAGAAQTMMNVDRVLPGTKVLMVGSGNVGLIVTYQLLLAGAEVVAVVEALPKIGGYIVHAAKLRRAGVPILTSTSILEARGKEAVEEATICSLDDNLSPIPGCGRTLEVDLICLAVGLSPLVELCWMVSCKFKYLSELGGFVPIHDENMKTTLSYLYVAGDVAGVEEASCAMEEGKLAGVSVAEELGYLKKNKAEEEKEKIRKRLTSLRLGPFGDMRAQAKLELMRARG